MIPFNVVDNLAGDVIMRGLTALTERSKYSLTQTKCCGFSAAICFDGFDFISETQNLAMNRVRGKLIKQNMACYIICRRKRSLYAFL